MVDQMDNAETSLDLTRLIVGPPDSCMVFCHRPGDLPKLLAYDWAQHGANRTIRVVAEGFSDRNVQFWSEEEWPHSIPLRREDFADERARVFVHEFPGRIKPTRFTLPQLSADMIDELGPINDYLLTYDEDTDRFGLRLREIKPEHRPYWFMARLAR